MKRIAILPSFERSVKDLTPQERSDLAHGLAQFNEFVCSGNAPFGFGFKKINYDKYEFRVGIRLRVIIKAENDIFYLVFVGNHEDIKRYLRKHR